ncbi:putative quinol monooxygenase [Roseobacter litoralis]|uniref:putative quinol monooxygenase n=1 Tax=Roseobacter litoralis TaxID=42443 RepID=UPI002494FFD7|nr:putative quinol monooxygenase [Roseobacter litoralis]
MFAVTVTFSLKAGRAEKFMPLMYENARASLENEVGCLQFDVATDSARPDEVFLYEIYSDAAAFDAHLRTAHFQAFDTAIGDMIAAKDIKTYRSVVQ